MHDSQARFLLLLFRLCGAQAVSGLGFGAEKQVTTILWIRFKNYGLSWQVRRLCMNLSSLTHGFPYYLHTTPPPPLGPPPIIPPNN